MALLKPLSEVGGKFILNWANNIWIRQHYHDKIHSATRQKPIVAFESEPTPLRIADLVELEDAFLLEETRTVDKTCRFKLRNLEW